MLLKDNKIQDNLSFNKKIAQIFLFIRENSLNIRVLIRNSLNIRVFTHKHVF